MEVSWNWGGTVSVLVQRGSRLGGGTVSVLVQGGGRLPVLVQRGGRLGGGTVMQWYNVVV